MKETMEMIQILEQNKKAAQLRRIEAKKKEQKKEQMRTGILLALVIILLFISLGVLKSVIDKDYNNCIQSGKSETVCQQLRSIDK